MDSKFFIIPLIKAEVQKIRRSATIESSGYVIDYPVDVRFTLDNNGVVHKQQIQKKTKDWYSYGF